MEGFAIWVIMIVIIIISSSAKAKKQREEAEAKRMRMAAEEERRRMIQMQEEQEMSRPVVQRPVYAPPQQSTMHHPASGTTSASTECSHEGESTEIAMDPATAERIRRYKAAQAEMEARRTPCVSDQRTAKQTVTVSDDTGDAYDNDETEETLFEPAFDKRSLLSGIIYAEIIGKPKCLRR